jgi:hypothetical protein
LCGGVFEKWRRWREVDSFTNVKLATATFGIFSLKNQTGAQFRGNTRKSEKIL